MPPATCATRRPPQLIGEAAGFPVERVRQRVRDAVYAAVPERRAAGVLAALAVGDQAAIEREDWERFRNTGVAHLTSISGLHITMFAWLAGLGLAAVWRRSRRAMLALPASSAARWGGLAAATAYAVFSGWGVPAQRTIWMLAAVCLLQSAGLRWPWLLVLLAASTLVTLLDPWVRTVPAAPLWAQVAGLLAAGLAIFPLPWRARLLALPLALALLFPPRLLPAEGSFDLLAADVGQGSAILVRTRSHVMLFDAGPQYSRESDAGQRVLVPLLRARGDAPLDLLVLSHRDVDHVGGAKAVLGALGAEALASSLDPAHPLTALAKRTSRCEAGQRWRWDGVEFAVLRPAADDYARNLKPNALSCVIRVAGGGRSVLLTGDIERDQEALLVAEHGSRLQSDVLIVPHHGIKTSSSAVFLDAVRPQVAVVQAGYRNRFGHPAAEVLARYRERGIRVVASPACGAWQWRSDAEPGVARCERDAARRYWQGVFDP